MDSTAQSASVSTAMEEISVKVALRIRPLVAKERMENSRECIRIESKESIVLGKDRRFTFDAVYGPKSNQEQIYVDCVNPLVDSCFKGYNASVLAYGQTGSGKTFTMGSGNNSALLEEELGVIPRVIRDIYAGIDDRKEGAEFMVRCSFLEIYNEEVRDLLYPDTPSKSIHIRERANGEIFVAGVREEVAASYNDMARLLERGSVGRTVGATLMNQQSSRSHAIFTFVLEQHMTSRGEGAQEYTTAKFHLVDLAGSERNKKTGASGTRFKESVTINCGLLALGNVISALGDETKRGGHVPYRESKLTRLLQDSLGGNSRTCMIACASGADANIEESLNTLKYANRAKNIKNKPVINRDPEQAQLAQMRDEINALQSALLKQKSLDGDSILEVLANFNMEALEGSANRRLVEELYARMVGNGQTGDDSKLQEQHEAAEKEVARLRGELSQLQSQVAALNEQVLAVTTEKDHSLVQLEAYQKRTVDAACLATQLEAAGEISAPIRAHLCSILGMDQPAEPTTSQAARPASAHPSSTVARRPPTSTASTTALERPGSAVTEPRLNLVRPKTANPSSRGAGQEGAGGVGEAKGVIEQHLQLIRSLEDNLSRKDALLQERENQLGEAQEDLARDEVIFVEKVSEIKKLQARVKELASEKEHLGAEHTMLMTAMQEEYEAALVQARKEGPGPTGQAPTQGTFGLAAEMDLDDEVLYEAEGFENDEDEAEAERERLAKEREDIDKENERLRMLEESTRREFELSKLQLEHQLRDLTYNIEQKAELIRELSQNEQEARLLNDQYARRMQELESEVALKESELERMREEYEMLENDKTKANVEKRKLREAYDEKLRKVQSQLTQLKRQQQIQESNRIEKLRLKSEVKVTSLEAEVLRMRQHQDLLKKKIKESVESYEEHNKAMAKEKKALLAEADAGQRRIRELESENSRQRILLKRREAELAQAQKRLREQASAAAGGINAQPPDRPESRRRPSTATAPPGATGEAEGSRPVSARTDRRPEKESSIPSVSSNQVRAALNDEVTKLLRAEEAAGALKAHEAKRNSLIEEREACLRERANLELRHKRSEAALGEQLREATKTLEAVEVKLQAAERDANQGVEGAAERMETLRAEHLQIYQVEAAAIPSQQQNLFGLWLISGIDRLGCGTMWCIASHSSLFAPPAPQWFQEACRPDRPAACRAVLNPEDEEAFRELEDRLDALDTEEEYIAGSIASLHKAVTEGQASNGTIRARMRNISRTDAPAVFDIFVEQLAGVRHEGKREQRRVCHLEDQLREEARMREELVNRLQVKEMEYDSRTTQLQREHARKVQLLLAQINAVHKSASAPLEPEPGATRGPSAGAGKGSAPAGEAAGKERESRDLARSSGGKGGGKSEPAEESAEMRKLIQLKDQQIQALDRDNYYYKQTNRELKRRLREMVNTSETDNRQEGPRASTSREIELEKTTKSLMEENNNLRVICQRAGLGRIDFVPIYSCTWLYFHPSKIPAVTADPLPLRRLSIIGWFGLRSDLYFQLGNSYMRVTYSRRLDTRVLGKPPFG
ncbi:hypothetical protein CYMTET_3141 [Cymbomonas tetramitiformis]|uniref:Kinesin motor domain-containing protein n=1 Tax=Cymbomonas tetramitiformis TaxID=36881 RepID=A0AAE0LLP1_9CHLO|nr:hypothetical protein CYMTET_3141 [Cymbomonas tetramitiformis]